MNLVSQYPWWYYFLAILLCFIVSLAFYYKDKKLMDLPLWSRLGLAMLRGITLSLLAFLLLGPLLLFKKVDYQKPIIVFLQDQSESMQLATKNELTANAFGTKISNLKEELSNQYETKRYGFGASLIEWETALENLDQRTDINKAIEEVQQRFEGQNLGAIILASDGIVNQGMNPVYNPRINTPVYSIALGDTTIYKDLKLGNVLHNKMAVKGNLFPIEIDVLANGCLGEKSRLEIYYEGKKIKEQNIDINKELFSQTILFQIEALKKGLQRYQLRLIPIEGEQSLVNNEEEIFIEVIDAQSRVLLLYEAPHPDISAIKRALAKSENYHIRSSLLKDFKGDLEEQDLLIAHQLGIKSASKSKTIIDQAKEKGLPVWFFASGTNQANFISENVEGLKITTKGKASNRVSPILDPSFNLFNFSEDDIQVINDFPPAFTFLGNHRFENAVNVLFNQKIGLVPTELPLFVFERDQNWKRAYFFGEGLWKWRMHNFKEEKNHSVFDQLIQKSAQFLALKGDKDLLRLSHESQFFDNEVPRIDAQLFNPSYELINESEIELIVKNEKEEEFKSIFLKNSEAYFLQLKGLEPGKYTYVAKVLGQRKSLTKSGSFSILELNLEAKNTRANHNLLFQLASSTGGAMLYPDEMNQIPNILENRSDLKTLAIEEEDLEDIINLKLICALILILLSIEWLIRKLVGTY